MRRCALEDASHSAFFRLGDDDSSALEARFHLIDTFQLGDLTHTNPLRADDDMHVGTVAVGLLKLIYYIVLGFYCGRGCVC